MEKNRQIWSLLLLVIICTSAFAAGFFAHEYINFSRQEYPILTEVRQIIARHALIDPPEEKALEYGMIRGMLSEFRDPHTRFVEPIETEITSDNLEGRYGGIGATLDRDSQNFVILHPFPESPAKEAGIMDGDRLILVDELSIVPEISTNEVVAALRGPEGDPVSLSVARPPGYETYDFKIKRQSIPLPSVTWYSAPADPDVGIIKVNLIAASTADEIEKAVDELQSLDAKFFVLDLRGNGGGLVDAGVSIARLFLAEGDVLQEQYRGKPLKTYSVQNTGLFSDIPIAVLVDANTASAAEIVAGALQAQGRADLIGQTTYGKDSIQLAFDLSDGSSLHVTAAKWWLPGLDQDFGENGLLPDVLVPLGETDLALSAAIDYFSKQK